MTTPPADDPRRDRLMLTRRRHIRILGSIALITLLAGIYSVGILLFKLPSPMDLVSVGKSCDFDGKNVVPAKPPVSVSVLNASGKNGMAKNVGDQLKKDGFKVGALANSTVDPAGGAEVQIRYREGYEPQALTASLYFASADMEIDESAGSTIQIVVGSHFTKLVSAKTAKAEMTPQPLPCIYDPKPKPTAHPSPSSPAKTSTPVKKSGAKEKSDGKKTDSKKSDKKSGAKD